MVMKSRKRTVKTPAEELIIKFFMEEPLPIVITRAKDGAYVEVNKTAAKLMGLPRKQIIGHTSIELGFFSPELRKLLIDDIKKQGFAKNIPGKIIVKNQADIYLLFRAFPIKMGKETFFMICTTDVANHKSAIGELSDDKLFKITLKDDKFVKEKLKHYQLSPRQQEIALLSATGHSNNEIAKKLFISPYTVKDHQKEIFRIIGIDSRNELFPKLLNLR
jgi:DNA-binding CsgD family transcriptional regulator